MRGGFILASPIILHSPTQNRYNPSSASSNLQFIPNRTVLSRTGGGRCGHELVCKQIGAVNQPKIKGLSMTRL